MQLEQPPILKEAEKEEKPLRINYFKEHLNLKNKNNKSRKQTFAHGIHVLIWPRLGKITYLTQRVVSLDLTRTNLMKNFFAIL